MARTTRLPVIRVRDIDPSDDTDEVAVEEPLEIRIGERAISVTMRTPGDDFELAAGFLFTESIVSPSSIQSIRHWGSPNVVRVDLVDGLRPDLSRLERHFYTTSSCGVCGKSSLEAVRLACPTVETEVSLRSETVHALAGSLRMKQEEFARTGGLHAAGIFSIDGGLLRIREDVGRHNAVDKVIGSMLLEGTPLSDALLFVSGRTSFEIVQKAAVAGIPFLAAVGAPTSLAVELAEEAGITLLGFVRDGRFNVYSHRDRVG